MYLTAYQEPVEEAVTMTTQDYIVIGVFVALVVLAMVVIWRKLRKRYFECKHFSMTFTEDGDALIHLSNREENEDDE